MFCVEIFNFVCQGPYINSKSTADEVKAEVVEYARQTWPMFFSRFFEVSKVSGKTVKLICYCKEKCTAKGFYILFHIKHYQVLPYPRTSLLWLSTGLE